MIDSSGASTDLVTWVDALAGYDGRGLTDTELVDQLTALERLKAAAAQARVTERFDRSQREAATRKDTAEVSRSISGQVALARRDSAVRGQQHLGVALGLVRDLPHTLAALTRGEISEWRATLVVRETALLSREDRLQVDAELAGRLTEAGDRRVADLARAIGYRLDPARRCAVPDGPRPTAGSPSGRRPTR